MVDSAAEQSQSFYLTAGLKQNSTSMLYQHVNEVRYSLLEYAQQRVGSMMQHQFLYANRQKGLGKSHQAWVML